jgi:hypothetical protein
MAREDERPIWRVTLELNLSRDFASEADVMKVYAALAADTTNADLQDLYTRTLNIYQQRQGQIEDLYIAEKYDRKDNWVARRPRPELRHLTRASGSERLAHSCQRRHAAGRHRHSRRVRGGRLP